MSVWWEKIPALRWIARNSRESKPFFYTFATVLGVIPGVIGYFVMQGTSAGDETRSAQLRQNSRPESIMMAQVNKERLAEFLGELQRKEDTNDRYVAALKGQILTRNPYVSVQPLPKDPEDNSSSTINNNNINNNSKDETNQLPKK